MLLGPLEPTPQQKENQLEEIYELNKKVHDKILIVPYEMFNNRLLKTKEPSRNLRSTCSMCDNLTKYEWLEILEDGKAYACAPLNLEFGDIRTDSIQQIMDRMRTSEPIKKLADRNNLKGKCGVCEFKINLRWLSSPSLHLQQRQPKPRPSMRLPTSKIKRRR